MRKLFKSLPVMGAIRSRSGKILDATDRLLESAGLTRRQAIGKHVAAVFGSHVRVWLAADREALRARHAIERLEYSERSGRWWRSHHVPASGAVLWVGEDATDKVQLTAIRALLRETIGPNGTPGAIRPDDVGVAASLLEGIRPLAIAVALGSLEEFAGSCVRLTRS